MTDNELQSKTLMQRARSRVRAYDTTFASMEQLVIGIICIIVGAIINWWTRQHGQPK